MLTNLLNDGHAVTAFERSPDAWRSWEAEDGPVPATVDCIYDDIVSHASVMSAVAGADALVHTAVFFPPSVPILTYDFRGH